MRRRWLWFVVPAGLLLLLFAAAAFKLLVEAPPSYARVEALQARFAEPIAFLREMAADHPGEGCAGGGTPEEVLSEVELTEPWWDRMEERRSLFEDLAILQAAVVLFCEDAEQSFAIRYDDDRSMTVSKAMFVAPDEFPAVSLWYGGQHRVVRYEDRVERPGEMTTGIRMIFDLEALAAEDGKTG